MRKIFLTMLLLVAAFASMSAQDEIEQTDYPWVYIDDSNGCGTEVIFGHDDPEAVIYWRYSIDSWDDWSEWMMYVEPVVFTQVGITVNVQAYAISPGKTASDYIYCEFVVEDPIEMYYRQIADFGVDGIYYKKTSASTVNVSMNDTYDFPYTEPWGWEEFSNGSYSGDVVIPATVEYEGRTYIVEGINSFAFLNCPLTSITLPNGLKSIANRAFLHATIENGSIFIPASVTTIEAGAFADCYKLESVRIDENNPVYDSRDNCNAIIETVTNTLVAAFNSTTIPSTVTAIGDDAFAGDAYSGWGYYTGCAIPDIVLPNSVKTIGNRAFYLCSDLRNISIGDEVTVIGDYAFFWCGLSGITIPNTVNTIGEGAFYYCTNLTSVDIPNSVTSIGNSAFCGSGLKSVIIPNSIISISSSMFKNCGALTSVTIPNSVTAIGDDAFNNTSLESVTIPSSVTSIGKYAFFYCDSLTKAICQATTPPAQNGVFFAYTYSNIYERVTLFVPNESLEAYRVHAEWGKFTHIVPFIGAGPGDVNGDGSIAINDVTNLIDMLLSADELPAWADVDGDGSVTIKDVTTLIDMLLNGN
ncbi:MAG: leucine-rich repeat protein [Muribaculaceae bacterium]|nr:leucine-rich repeat protein [Muribaculaceae bacterium]